MSNKLYRLVTRSDMDGLVSAVLLKEQGLVDTIKFVHPKDVQDGKIDLGPDDITTNLPYSERVHLAFDHHVSETMRVGEGLSNHIIEASAPSAARVVYNHFGGKAAFPRVSDEMMAAVDKADSAQFNAEEVLHPSGWVLLNFVMDARTGLGRFKTFRISNYELMMTLIDKCRDLKIDDILALPDVQERVNLYFALEEKFKEQIDHCAALHGRLIVLDLKGEEIIYPGNRFMIYAMYPETTLSMHVLWGVQKQNTAFAVGKSIFNRSCKLNIGELMLEYGGGGHAAAGTCQVDNVRADFIKEELIERLSAVA